MEKIEIYLSDDGVSAEMHSIMKECRSDVLVAYDGSLYMLDFMTLKRIRLEYKLAQTDNEAYYLNNTVVVKNVKTATIIKEIVKLAESNALKTFSTVDLKQAFSTAFPELQDIRNWKRVY